MTLQRPPCVAASFFRGMEVLKMNFLQKIGRKAKTATVAAVGMVASGVASAQSDYSTLTGAVDWSDVGAAILTVFAAIVGVLVVFKGGKLILRAVRGA